MKLAKTILCLGTALLATLSASAQILPGEQAPPANPGQRNFGGFQTQNRNRNRDTTGMAAMMRARMAEMNRVRTLTFDELSMSDPFIYPDPETHTYYLTSSGGRMYKSKDLKTWEGPYNIIDIKTIDSGYAGKLSFFEGARDIPFEIKRIYYISKVPEGVRRGFHAHKELKQLLFCPYGRIQLVFENRNGREEIELSDPSIGVVIEQCTWREMLWLQKDSVLCVAASDYYKADDYIRDYQEFKAYCES